MALSVSMTLLVLVVLALCVANGAYAFGAGEIPDVSAMAKIGGSHYCSYYYIRHVSHADAIPSMHRHVA